MERLDENPQVCDDGLTVVRGPAEDPEGSELQLRALTFCAARRRYISPAGSGERPSEPAARVGLSKIARFSVSADMPSSIR